MQNDINRHRQAFTAFHQKNPQVFELFRRFAEQARRSGQSHYSAMAIIDRIRWHTTVETTDLDFKINNCHTPYYARLLEDTDPKFRGFFRMRRVRGESLKDGARTRLRAPAAPQTGQSNDEGKYSPGHTQTLGGGYVGH